MFTGIVLGMGKLVSLKKGTIPTLTVQIDFLRDIKIGDSIAVNGACLTVVKIEKNNYLFNLSAETLKLSNFSDLTRGGYVNIELPLTLNALLSGHLVSGHLDGTVRIKSISKRNASVKFSCTFQDKSWKKFLVHKGSVTLNGISLTISEIKHSFFSVEIIPHTLNMTNFKYIKVGERVNIELDLLGKYLYNLQNQRVLK